MINKAVCVIRSSCQHYSKGFMLLCIFYGIKPGSLNLCSELSQCITPLFKGLSCSSAAYSQGIYCKCLYLPGSVLLAEPVKLRSIKLNTCRLLRILKVSHNHRITHNYRAYMYASLLPELRRHMHDKRHKYPVCLSLYQLSYMSMHQLCREAYCIRGYILQA